MFLTTTHYLKFGDAIREFLRSTSTHGLRRVGWSQYAVVKFLWAFIFMLAFIGYIYALISLLSEYYDYPTKVVIEKSIAHQPFPGVTICNLNRLKAETVQPSPLDTMTKFVQDAFWNISIPDGEPSPYLREKKYFLEQLALYDYETRTGYGHKLSDLIIHCSFRGRECDLQNDFIQVWNNAYGNCYTFSGGKIRHKNQIKQSNESGPLNGLSLIAYTEPAELMKTLTESKGVQVLIHPSTDMPFPEAGGMAIPPMMETFVSVEVEEYHYLGDPYSSCVERVEDFDFQYSYSAIGCEKLCKQMEMKRRCNCVDPTLPLTGEEDVHCPIDNIHVEKYGCHQSVLERLQDGEIECNCPPPCIETRYKTDVSLATWPAKNHKAVLLKMLAPVEKKSLDPLDDSTQFTEAEMEDMVALKVFLKDIGKTVFTEKATFTFADFLSHMGGLSAMFIGVSILTVIEFLELLFTLFTIPCVYYPPWPEDVEEVECVSPRNTEDIYPIVAEDYGVNARPLPQRAAADKKIVASS